MSAFRLYPLWQLCRLNHEIFRYGIRRRQSGCAEYLKPDENAVLTRKDGSSRLVVCIAIIAFTPSVPRDKDGFRSINYLLLHFTTCSYGVKKKVYRFRAEICEHAAEREQAVLFCQRKTLLPTTPWPVPCSRKFNPFSRAGKDSGSLPGGKQGTRPNKRTRHNKGGNIYNDAPARFFTIQQTGINQNRKIILDLGLVYELLSRNGYRWRYLSR